MSRPDVSLIIPTYEESANLPILIERIATALAGRSYEVIVVDDDSPDGTWLVAEGLAAHHPVRVFRRLTKRGLSSAIADGFSLALGEALVVMDADLQHDPAILPRLVEGLGRHEVVVATRYRPDGGTGSWGGVRLLLSRCSTWMAHRALGAPTSDPMSGYFAIRRELFRRVGPLLKPRGYKILIDILHHGGVASVGEVPYTFSERTRGSSKVDARVLLECCAAMWELRCGRLMPLRFVKYCLVGVSGVFVQLLSLLALRQIPDLRTEDARLATALAIVIAMCSNYVLDNLWTFRDLRRRTTGGIVRGWLIFCLICGLGAAISWSVAQGVLLASDGAVDIYAAALIGIAAASIWNYVLNRHFTWTTER